MLREQIILVVQQAEVENVKSIRKIEEIHYLYIKIWLSWKLNGVKKRKMIELPQKPKGVKNF